MHTIKRMKNKTITVMLVIALAVSCIFGALTLPRHAAHADDDTTEFAPTSAGISNPHFDSTSGSYPASPSSWTGAAVGNGSGNVISGVVDLSGAYFNSGSGNKEFELNQYPEYKDDINKPQTIFGANSGYGGSDEKALLINTAPGAEAAYAYKSSDMTFSPNSYYRVSAWVKTGDFAPDTGATIKLSGLGENCSFMNINTVKDIAKADGIPVLTKDNDYGWTKYTFYVRTSVAYSRTVNLVLGIGDAVEGTDEDSKDVMPRAAKGYAFFDTVTAERISAHDYTTETRSFEQVAGTNRYRNNTGRSMALDLYDADNFELGGVDLGTFSDNVLSTDASANVWTGGVYYDEYGDNNASAGVAHSLIYNSENIIRDLESKDNIYGFTQNPCAPLGNAEHSNVVDMDGYKLGGSNANILMISTYDGNEFQNAAYGVASPTVKIERYKYYRFSVWVKSDSVNGSSGIGILVKGKRTGANNDRKLGEYSGLSGDSSDAAHYGWKEQVVYIKGSMLYDYDVRFELWLGTPASKASGIALFDNVTFTELSYSEYTGMSGADNGNVLSNIDTAPTETGITNGNLYYVGDFEDELEFPMPVADWTVLTPESVEIPNGDTVDTSVATHGLIPTDSKFDELYADGVIGSTVKNPNTMAKDLNNVLLISSATPTAIGYRSATATVSSGSAYRFTVDMAVDGVTDGVGAALVLRTSSGDVLATIQNIKNTHNAFKTYTFHVNAPRVGGSVSIEVWLGYGDTVNAKSKLSNGNIYIKSVGMSEWTAAENSTLEEEYGEILKAYQAAVTSEATLNALDYAVYSFDAPSFDYYDVYSYGNGSLGVPYQWSRSSANGNVISGVFNPENLKGLNVYEGFDSKGLTGNMLYIHNTQINRTTYSFANSITTEANKYYKLSIDVKVRVTDEIRKDKTSVGATLRLTGAVTAELENIKDTTSVIGKNEDGEVLDYETFKTYSFLISSGDSGGDIGLEIMFGGNDRSGYIEGKLIVANIRLEETDNLEYEEAQAAQDDEDNAKYGYVKAVALSETDSGDDDTNNEAPSNEIQWWILPTVIFSVALLAVIIIIIVVKIRDYIKKKKKVTYSTEYDRADTIRDIERLQKQADADKTDKAAVPELDATEHDELDDDFGTEANKEEATEDAEASEEAENTDGDNAEVPEENAEPEKPAEPEKKADSSADLDD